MNKGKERWKIRQDFKEHHPIRTGKKNPTGKVILFSVPCSWIGRPAILDTIIVSNLQKWDKENEVVILSFVTFVDSVHKYSPSLCSSDHI